MRTIATFLLALALTATSAENYQTAMKLAIEAFQTSKSIEDFTDVANTFQRISKAEKEEWLPLYYHAQSFIMMSFMSSEGADQKDAYLDVAQISIDAMLSLNSEESEIYTLQSLLYTARLVVDPMNRGQQMMAKSGEAIGKALGLNPMNPRAQYMLLSNEVGMAQFFGKDVTEYCDRINNLYQNWDSMNQVAELYPTWGKGEVEKLKKNCI